MAIAGTIKMTAAQFLQLGEDPAGVRLELVNGEVAIRSLEGHKLVRGKCHRTGAGKNRVMLRLPPFADCDIPLAEPRRPRRR